MIDEMGTDRHMEEILRVADQQEMTEEAFREFLRDRGWSRDEIQKCRKADKDLSIQSGPHLGGFNQGISLPEITHAVATMSAMCMAGKYGALRNE